jgi:membrane-bound inhibitor of C-type lysozyme
VFAATFQGQEKLTLTFAGERRILQAQRAASGAKYVGGSVAFWNKGNEAMIEWDGQAFNCVQKVST